MNDSVQPDAETWAYIAGFFDGEGSLTWDGNYHRVDITQTKERGRLVCEWLCETVGLGRVRLNRPARGLHSDLWGWYVSGPGTYVFLKQVRPYCRVKAVEVERALDHLDQQLTLAV